MASKKPKQDPGSPEAPAKFEEAIARLGSIVESLEGGELPLEESLRLFEEGIKLARGAQHTLNKAEKRVEELLGIDEDGEPQTQPFEED